MMINVLNAKEKDARRNNFLRISKSRKISNISKTIITKTYRSDKMASVLSIFLKYRF